MSKFRESILFAAECVTKQNCWLGKIQCDSLRTDVRWVRRTARKTVCDNEMRCTFCQ